MASPFSKSPSPPKRESPNKGPAASARDAADGELLHSLKQLSLSTSPAVASPRSPNPRTAPFRPAVDRSPSSPRPASALRGSLNGSSTSNGLPSRSPSRSATPTLLRKASMNSLHSVNGVAPPRRASSVNLMSHSPVATRSPLRSASPEPPKPAPTAASVASAHFQRELEVHHSGDGPHDAETVVILHDSCYGHRFSRPRTSRANLSTIVERPERIKASVLGVSAAYVRLGERHMDGAVAIHPRLNIAAIDNIPFRIQKTTRKVSLLSQAVTNVHGSKWMDELKIMCDSAEAKLAMNGKELVRPEMSRAPGEDAPPRLHEGDLYLCAESLDALEGSLGGVCDAVDAVFASQGPKRAFVAIRPPGHHCSASFPSGFCWINNVHVGIMHAILSHGLTHAAIIDFDLHHGDGSQAIAWEHNSRCNTLGKNAALWKKTSIGYFSLHDINSYPCEYGDEEKVKNASLCIDNAHGQNIWNVHLQPWKTEADFWALYETKYSVLLEKTRSYLRDQAERLRSSRLNSRAAIFLSAGFDASEWESPGMQRHKVNVPTEFYARLTRDVVRIAAEEGTNVEGRIISVLEGGYSDRALYTGILSHLSGLAGDDPVPTKDQEFNGLGLEMGRRIGSVHGRKDSSASERGSRSYEPAWWALPELEALETTMADLPPPEPRKPRSSTPPTYSSPTQSSSAKTVTPKVRRSVSGLSTLSTGSPLSRAPTPPPPEVPWTVAAHELSKLLIPSERQTDSCTHEDLAAEATRARKERQSLLATTLPQNPTASAATTAAAPSRMALRERKTKPLPIDEEDEEEKERKNRRKTVAGPSVLITDRPNSRAGAKPGRGGRRLSAASTIVPDAHETSDLLTPLSATTVNGFSRPETSQSIRPESSMSVRTNATTASLAVKKTRPVNSVKKEPVPRAPRVPKKASSAATSAASTPVSKPSASSAGTATGASSTAALPVKKEGDPMDNLANDMKKIKITLITKEQREARERERVEKAAAEKKTVEDKVAVKAENITPPPASTIPATPSAFNGTAEIPDSQPLEEHFIEPPPPMDTPAGSSTPAYVRRGPMTPLRAPERVPLPSSPAVPSGPATPIARNGSVHAHPAAPPTPDMFVSYQPEGPPPETMPQQQPLQWLPPNVAATPAAMKRADLPVFTATSAIPFAPRQQQQAGSSGSSSRPSSASRPNDVVWEVPETPNK